MLGQDKSYLITENDNGALEMKDNCNSVLTVSWNTESPEEMIRFIKEGHDVRPFLLWVTNPTNSACVGLKIEDAVAIRDKLNELISKATE